MTISASAVKTLRDRTNMPMMDCKAALTEANGDMDKAVEILRKRNKDAQDKKADRETAEGRIAVWSDPAQAVAAIVEVRCESAPVTKSDLFIQLANDLARQVALKGPATPEELLAQPFVGNPKQTVHERIGEVVGVIRENMKPARFTRLSGGQFGNYVHHDGTVGVLLQVEGKQADPQLLRDICMHITAKNPSAAVRSEVPAATVEKEREIAREQIQADPKNKNKPANILDMIAEGKLKTWYAENVLEDQPFVKDDSRTVGDLARSAGIQIVRFVRYKVGEMS
jgi:elongation factor Ts